MMSHRRQPVRRSHPTGDSAGADADASGGGVAAAHPQAVHHLRTRSAPPAAVATVRFDRETRVYLIDAHWEWPQDDKADVWYSPLELQGLSRDVRKTVKFMRRRSRQTAATSSPSPSSSSSSRTLGEASSAAEAEEAEEEEEGVCVRGLEHLRSSAHMEQRKINRDCCLAAVYDEQSRQRDSGVNDKEKLRRASQSGSAWSRNNARLAARADERAAKRILEAHKAAARSVSAAAAAQRRMSDNRLRREHQEVLRKAVELCDSTEPNPFGGGPRPGQRRGSKSTATSSSSSPLGAIPVLPTRSVDVKKTTSKMDGTTSGSGGGGLFAMTRSGFQGLRL